jgi:hypothetical protein
MDDPEDDEVRDDRKTFLKSFGASKKCGFCVFAEVLNWQASGLEKSWFKFIPGPHHMVFIVVYFQTQGF